MTRHYLNDIWVAIELASKVGEVCQFSKELPIKDLEKTKFFKEWLSTQDIIDGISLQLFKNENIRIVLNVFYSKKNNFEIRALLEDLKILTPYLCQATMLWMKDVGVERDREVNLHYDSFKKDNEITNREWAFLITRIRTGNNQETAEIMNLEMSTMYTYTKRIYAKLNVKSFSQAALLLDGYTSRF